MKLTKFIIALAVLSVNVSHADTPNGITLTCTPEFVTYGTPNVQDNFYMWVTNTTTTPQMVHVKLFQSLDDNRQVASKEYDVNVMPGFYSLPPDFLHIKMSKKSKGLYRNVMTMDVTGSFVTMHLERTCYVKVI